MPDDGDKGFQVVDRRRFDEKGETRAEASEASTPPDTANAPASDANEAPPASEVKPQRSTGPSERPNEAIDFATFLLSLSSSAFYYLGDVPHPGSGRVERDLGLAKQTIDLLGMLQEKTKGNLTHEESQVLTGLLYELRMRYVEELRKDHAEKIV